MKILFNTYPMAFHTPGGGEIQLSSYQKYLSEHDISVGLFDQWNPSFFDFDLVHFFSCISGSLPFCAFVKSLGIPLIISPNLWITKKTKHLYPVEEIRNQLLQSNRIVVNSDMEADVLCEVFNLPRDWFTTIYNAVDNLFFESINPALFREQFNITAPFILNVGNIEPRKNQLNLIRAMKEFPELKLVMIGHQRDPDYAKACFVEAGEQLHYIEPLAHDSELLRSAYAACEVFVLPSTLETPGLAALEAAAAGARVVVTSEGSAREYFGDLVDYVEPDDLKSIVKGIKSARTRNNTLAGQIYLRANFTWERVTAHLANVYRELQTGQVAATKKDGFYPVEKDPEGHLNLWSSRRIEFEWEPGRLSFLWRSVSGATVDIIINGDRVLKGIDVSEEWTSFTLEFIARQGQNTAQIIFEITPNAEIPGDDPRQLGVAFRDVSFKPSHLLISLLE